MMRRRRRQSGFTLIEALVVVSIIGIVAAVAIPSLRRSRMRARMLEVVRTFQQATAVSRITAIKRGSNVCLQVLPDGNMVHVSQFRSWIDNNGNEVEDAGDEPVGVWQVRGVSDWFFEESASPRLMYVLNSAGGGSARGVVYQPNGMAISASAGTAGVGQGAFEFFVWYDARKWNTFRITVYGGAGTVQTEMWNPDAGDWDSNFAHWEYY